MAGGNKQFLLGVGAQKAGTTWLYSYLAASSNVATNNIKEHHIWDIVHDVPSLASHRVSKAQSDTDPGKRVRFILQQSPDKYFDYFCHLLNLPGKDVTCDITPAYAGLGRTVLRSIHDGFAARGVEAKAIFLMRDPVERCLSSARMRNRNTSAGRVEITDDEVVAHASLEAVEVRTRYDRTLAELSAGFVSEKTYVGFYEDMFAPEQVERLSAFCGVPVRPALTANRVNASAPGRTLGDRAARQIAMHYRPVYEAVAAAYPQAMSLWSGYRYL